MSLSDSTKKRLAKAVTSKAAADEISAAIDSQGSGPAAVVAAIGVTTNLPASNCAGVATPSATNVNAAIDAVTAATEARLDVIEAKVDAILAALKAAALMSAA